MPDSLAPPGAQGGPKRHKGGDGDREDGDGPDRTTERPRRRYLHSLPVGAGRTVLALLSKRMSSCCLQHAAASFVGGAVDPLPTATKGERFHLQHE